jgi:hypothetical protein
MTPSSQHGALGVALPCSPENAFMSLDGGTTEPPEGGSDMSSVNVLAIRADRKAVAGTAHELAALDKMSAGELAEKYREVFGEPPRTRNKQYLRKRIAWRIQERAEGGLSPRALERIEQLAPDAPARWRQQVARTGGSGAPAVAMMKPARDPRVPVAGTVITRLHDGVEHKITVLDEGFDYRGERHRSLSKIARLITGTPWNGYLFFFGRANCTRNRAEERAG